jgi:hypothetical protein
MKGGDQEEIKEPSAQPSPFADFFSVFTWMANTSKSNDMSSTKGKMRRKYLWIVTTHIAQTCCGLIRCEEELLAGTSPSVHRSKLKNERKQKREDFFSLL